MLDLVKLMSIDYARVLIVQCSCHDDDDDDNDDPHSNNFNNEYYF